MVTIREIFTGRRRTNSTANTELLIQLDEDTSKPLKGPDELGLEGFEEERGKRIDKVIIMQRLLIDDNYVRKP